MGKRVSTKSTQPAAATGTLLANNSDYLVELESALQTILTHEVFSAIKTSSPVGISANAESHLAGSQACLQHSRFWPIYMVYVVGWPSPLLFFIYACVCDLSLLM